jgi:hypothetical protein
MTDGWSLKQQNEHGKGNNDRPSKNLSVIGENDEDVL